MAAYRKRLVLNRVRESLIAVLVILGLSGAAWWLRLNLASASILDVVVVVVLARQHSFVVATVGSFACLLCLNFFFIPPVLTWAIADPQNWLTLGVFETTALVVSRLALRAEQQARLAQKERNESEQLHEVSRNLLLLHRELPPGPQIVKLVGRVCQAEAVAIFDAELARTDMAGAADETLEKRTREAYLADRRSDNGEDAIHCELLRFGVHSRGAIGLRGNTVTDSLMRGLSTLAAIGLESQRSFESESRAISQRHTERLRTAVLDALAHDFKTPLTTIQACSGGLLEVRSLAPAQRELAELIHEEAGRLDQLTNRLLRTARLDSQSVVLNRRPIVVSEFIGQVVAAQKRASREIAVSSDDCDAIVQGDADLLTFAFSQILDNAVRYSVPQTPISVRSIATEGEIVLSVTNAGNPIPETERSHIFERYYRVTGAANQIAGSGLGLSVTKSIVDAHRGRVWVESRDASTTFFLSLPLDRENKT